MAAPTTTHRAASMPVDDQIARRTVQQRAGIANALPGLLRREHAHIALLHEIGRSIAIFHGAGEEVQQF